VQHEPTSVVAPLNAELKAGGSGDLHSRGAHELHIELDPFTHEAIEQEAARMDVVAEELARFAIQYYLADRDSGRIARRLPLLPTDGPHPLDELLDD
jgi:hypothetical protein